MKPLMYQTTDNRVVEDRWDHHFRAMDMEHYIATLSMDEATDFLDRAVADLPAEARILDIGCGPGRHLHYLKRKGFNRLFGLDLSEQGVRRLHQFDPAIGAVVGDSTRLPLASASFDLVLMCGVIYEIPDAALHGAVWDEIARVLKPGGRLVFINNAAYNFGQRIFTVTNWLGAKLKGRGLRFFIYRYGRADVVGPLSARGLAVENVAYLNVPRGVFRFLYGVFVRRDVLANRRAMIAAGRRHTYEANEYYEVIKNLGLLNKAGRVAARFSRRWWPSLFAATEGYFARKTG